MTADTRIAIPLIIDALERKVIWCDMALRRNPRWQNNVHSNLSGIGATLQSLADLNKPNLLELLTLHARARGEAVETPEEADTVFSLWRAAFHFGRRKSPRSIWPEREEAGGGNFLCPLLRVQAGRKRELVEGVGVRAKQFCSVLKSRAATIIRFRFAPRFKSNTVSICEGGVL